MFQDRRNILHVALHLNVLDSIPMLPGDSKVVALYPYRLGDLSVIFFYGSDYQRQINDNALSKLKIFIFNWTNLLVILMAIVLFFVRRWAKLQRDGFAPVLIDIIVIFIGGGRLRMDHKIERWIFVIMSIGALFLNGICLGPTLFPSYLTPHRSIETFQLLAELNPPIFYRLVFRDQRDILAEMLK